MTDLQSSLKSKGKHVTQIIHFVGGVKRTFEGIKTAEIKQGQMTKLETKDGRIIMINDKNVLCIEVFSE
tara:strand:- start:9901 stop:10107 length:207 start_codon:yes stop_codon:yes gene_type:complete